MEVRLKLLEYFVEDVKEEKNNKEKNEKLVGTMSKAEEYGTG